MKPHEMADKLLELAALPCSKPFGSEEYSCREYDAAAMYDSRDAVCERCQACDALDHLREPWKSNNNVLTSALRDIERITDRSQKAVK